jgi:hypothetical protein
MTPEDRDAIRRAGAQDARASRAAAGLPEQIEDPAAAAQLAALMRGESSLVAQRPAKPRAGTLGGSNRMLSARDVAAILAVPERTVRDRWREWGLQAYRIGKHLIPPPRPLYFAEARHSVGSTVALALSVSSLISVLYFSRF